MSDTEFKQEILKSMEIQRKRYFEFIKWIVGIFLTVAVSFAGLIFYMGATYNDVQHLKNDAIMKQSEEWTQNDYRTDRTYFKVFQIPPEYQTRGGIID